MVAVASVQADPTRRRPPPETRPKQDAAPRRGVRSDAGPPVGSSEWIGATDAQLARLSRTAARDRLRLGEALLALADADGHHELGFSSLEAYALERCERGSRWARSSRSLARALRDRGLVHIRRALRTGAVGWSMAELLAKHATAETELDLLLASASKTVRQMKATLEPKPADAADDLDDEDEPERTTSRTVGRTELQIVEATRMLMELFDGHAPSDEAFVDALLGEAQSSLATLNGRRVLGLQSGPPDDALKEHLRRAAEWRRKLRREQEARAEARVLERCKEGCELDDEDDSPLPSTPRGLDAEIVRMGQRLAARDLELGEMADDFFARRCWRFLGYASAEQYARERLGISCSSVQHRVRLARRVRGLPEVAAALRRADIGYEAALLVARVATPDTAADWVDRARGRTLVHLREEVEAVRVARTFDDDAESASVRGALPPDDAVLEKAREIERSVLDGSFLADTILGLGAGPQKSVSLQSGDGETVRFRVSEDLHFHFRWVETEFRRTAEPEVSFIGFLCFSFWAAWLPTLEAHDVKWEEIYRRDRYRCTSPVCSRHDVTPHHLKFQAHGGGDEPENVTTLCPWCHLYGIHEGRLTATPPASDMRWTIGRDPVLRVDGRERVRL
jgi:hypothetical protein